MVSPDWLMANVTVWGSIIGIAIAKLRCVLDLDGNARVFLDDVLADQPRVPAGPAAEDDDPLDLTQFGVRHVQSAQFGQALLRG